MKSTHLLAAELAAISFLGLFQELALIRWLPTQVRCLAYFPNLILISAFLGLGVGALLAARRNLTLLWPVSLLSLAAAARLMSRVAFTQEKGSEHLWLLYHDLPREALRVGDVRPAILISFALAAVSFVPIGQQLAQRLEHFRTLARPLAGYCWDLLGSLLGVCLFAAASFFWTPPPLWFAVVAAVGTLALPRGNRQRLVTAGLVAAALAVISLGAPDRIYTPYYALGWEKGPEGGVLVTVNGSLHQQAIDVRPTPKQREDPSSTAVGYGVPYRLLGHPPGRVLVLGAGTGNDVAVALEAGAQSVDAVEIDPGILALGRAHHPNLPYASAKVHVHNTDARSFLEGTKERWDLIVFGTLDSMTNLSALSNVRLDNFVYTEQCLRAAKARLSERGGVVLYFLVEPNHVYQHILAILARVFDQAPTVDLQYRHLFNTIYLTGPAFALPSAEAAAARRELEVAVAGVDVPSDDWPYLYLTRPGISGFYLSIIGAIAALAVGAVLLSSRELRQSIAGGGGVDVQMVLLGLGFLLLESVSVTEMALTWGATWLTNAVVFAAVLLVVLLGTLLRSRFRLPWRASVLLLSAALVVSYLVPSSALLAENTFARLLLSVLFVGTPLFFASTLFADCFENRTHVDLAFGWNLLGAVLGGLAEFAAMAIGLRALHLIALAAYLGVALLRLRAQPAVSLAEGPA